MRWRSRATAGARATRRCYLHDPIFLDHFPYLPFPDHWPLYYVQGQDGRLARDLRQGDGDRFLGQHASARPRAMTTRSGEWTVTVTRGGETLTLRPKQLVLATGLSGAKHIPAIPGAERFNGQQYHSADHAAARASPARAASSSARTIPRTTSASTCGKHDAQVTMIQRSPTIVVRADTMRAVRSDICYAQPGVPTSTSRTSCAPPCRSARATSPRTAYRRLCADRRRFLRSAWRRAGFQLWHGEDETGFFMAYYRRAAGYYIDVGGSRADRQRARSSWPHGEIAELTEDGVRMADGTFLPADVIVYATGYRPMQRMGRPADLAGGGAQGRALLGPRLGHRRAIPARGKANCATCGSPPRRKDCGSRAATSCRPVSIRCISRCSSRRGWRA